MVRTFKGICMKLDGKKGLGSLQGKVYQDIDIKDNMMRQQINMDMNAGRPMNMQHKKQPNEPCDKLIDKCVI